MARARQLLSGQCLQGSVQRHAVEVGIQTCQVSCAPLAGPCTLLGFSLLGFNKGAARTV